MADRAAQPSDERVVERPLGHLEAAKRFDAGRAGSGRRRAARDGRGGGELAAAGTRGGVRGGGAGRGGARGGGAPEGSPPHRTLSARTTAPGAQRGSAASR